MKRDLTRSTIHPEKGMQRSTWRAASWAAQPSAREEKAAPMPSEMRRSKGPPSLLTAGPNYSAGTWQQTTAMTKQRQWGPGQTSKWTTTEAKRIGNPKERITEKAMPHMFSARSHVSDAGTRRSIGQSLVGDEKGAGNQMNAAVTKTVKDSLFLAATHPDL